MAIILFQHSDRCVPGRLGASLRDHGLRLEVRRLDLPAARGGTGIPPDFDDVDGVISMGGPQNVTEDLPWMQLEMSFLRDAHARKLPVVGVCLGAQMLAHALGGSVGPMAGPEVGFVRVTHTPPAHTDTVLAGVPWDNWLFNCHEQEVKSLPPGATLLQTSASCKVQSFRAGLRTYGFQYHFEADLPMAESFVRVASKIQGVDGQNPTQTGDQPGPLDERRYAGFARVADRICVNLATCLFLTRRGVAL